MIIINLAIPAGPPSPPPAVFYGGAFRRCRLPAGFEPPSKERSGLSTTV